MEGGPLFFLCAILLSYRSVAQTTELARDLLKEGSWQACIRECQRGLAENAESDQLKLQLTKAIAELHLGKDATQALRKICNDPSASADTVGIASYELGRALWLRGDAEQAFLRLKTAFLQSSSREMFRQAGCSLNALLRQYPRLKYGSPGIHLQLKACAATWSCEPNHECSMEQSKVSIPAKPGEWLIRLYRAQIGPALGRRCSLDPSCSEYALRALRKHGVLGMALIGDRTVREPSVIRGRRQPVRIGGRWRYRDLLSDHDWWMK